MPVEAARKRLRDLHLKVRVNAGWTACPPYGWVTYQRPGPGVVVRAHRAIDLVVTRHSAGECGLGLPAAPAHLRGVAEAFLDFARGDEDRAAPVAPRLSLMLGNSPNRTISRAVAGRHSSWRVCPAEGGYAGRVCPFSAVEPLRFYVGPIAITSARPSHSCAHPTALPQRFDALESVTLTPDESRTCTDYFAVQLFVDDGLIAGVNLVWAEP